MKCRACGSETRVLETRASGNGMRRRRICERLDCGARTTTMEVRVPDDYHHNDGEIVVVAKKSARALLDAAEVVLELFGGAT